MAAQTRGSFTQPSGAKYAKAQCLAASASPSTADLAWAAGFIEGEGNFTPVRVRMRSGERRGYARVTAFQNNQEPLNKLVAMFGGSIRRVQRPRGTELAGAWTVNGARARGVMLTLFSFLSARRRKQIAFALNGGN